MVSYEDRLPLKWEPGDASEARDDSERDRANVHVLESAAAVEEKPSERLSEEYPEIHQELRRLDAKLHVLMSMVARLLRDEADDAACRPVRIALKSLEFRAETGEAPVGEAGTLRLQIHPAVPAQLVMSGRITGETRHEDGRWVSFEPGHLSRSLRNALSRHVFRHHRRQVAAGRRPPASDTTP